MSAAPRPAIGLVDDDGDYRDTLKGHLKPVGVNLVTFSTAQEFLEAAVVPDSKPFGCVLVDQRMPEMDGMQLIKELHAKKLAIPVILISGHADVPLAVEAIKAGAFDVLDKKAKPEQFAERVKAAIAVYARIRRFADERKTNVRRFAKLTPRENQVLDLMMTGKPNREIAAELGISPKTLDIHRSNVMDKLDARTLADVVRFRLVDKIDNLSAIPAIF